MTQLLGTYANPGGVVLAKGSIHFRLSRSATLTAGGGGPRKINPWEEQVYRITNGVISGPGTGPYTIYGLDVLLPAGLYYEVTILSNDQRVIDQFQTAAIVGASVDIGAIAIVPPGGIVGNLAGDVTGPESNTTVEKIRNRPVAATAPATGAPLKYDGTQWEPSTLLKDTDNKLTIQPASADGTVLEIKNQAGTVLATYNTSTSVFSIVSGEFVVGTDNIGAFHAYGNPSGTSGQFEATTADTQAYGFASAGAPAAGAARLVVEKTDHAQAFDIAISTAGQGTGTLRDLLVEFLTSAGDARFQVDPAAATITAKDADILLKNGGTEKGRLYAATGNAQFDGTVTADTQLRGAIWASSWASLGITGGGGGTVQFAPAAGLYTFVAAGVAAGFTLDTMVPPGNSSGWRVEIFNRTGFTMTVVNNSGIGGAGEDIFTPSGANQAILNNGYVLLAYDYDNLDGVGRGWRLLEWRT